MNHNWGDAKCLTCGAEISVDELAKRWAEKLQSNKDYHALAAHLCAYHEDCGDPLGYYHSVDLWNAKDRWALKVLREVGTAAVDPIISALETGKNKDIYVALLLVEIGDPQSVPLLKKLLDRSQWHNGHREIEEFVRKYPQCQGEAEKATCPICGRSQPVNVLRPCGDKFFCKESCYSRRGRVLEHSIAADCPYYDEGVCMAGGRDTGLCTLPTGSYQTNCSVYALHGG